MQSCTIMVWAKMKISEILINAFENEAIHPFLDGNGWVGWLLVTFPLVAWGLLFQPLLNLS